MQHEVGRLQAELPQLESQAAPVRLQLGCERSTVAAHREDRGLSDAAKHFFFEIRDLGRMETVDIAI